MCSFSHVAALTVAFKTSFVCYAKSVNSDLDLATLL